MATYKTSSIKELKAVVNTGSKSYNSVAIPNIAEAKTLFQYDENTKATTMLGVNIDNGLGGVLSQGLINAGSYIQFTDNSFLNRLGEVALDTDPINPINNFNSWIEREKQLGEKVELVYQNKQRQQGTVFLTGNYELGFAGPLDARLVTDTVETLVDPKWWIGSYKRPVYFYTGMVVTVKADNEMYVYTGIDRSIKSDDPTSSLNISADNWKRVTFRTDDVLDVPLLIFSHEDAQSANRIYSNTNTYWTSKNALFISAEKTLKDIGVTVATDYILLGSHMNPDGKYLSCQRQFVNNRDFFTGLSIIPNQPNKAQPAYKGQTERVELQAVNVPILLRGRYEKSYDSSTQTTLYDNHEITINKDGINIQADSKTISINSNTLNLSNTSYLTLGTITANADMIKTNVNRSILMKSSMLTMEVAGGTYLSTGDEANIVAGAFSIHTTGYTEAALNNNDTILLNPISFDYGKGYLASKACFCNSLGNKVPAVADYVRVYDLNSEDVELSVIPVASQDPYSGVSYDNHTSLTTEFPNITLSSAADFTKNSTNGDLDGFLGGSTKSAIIPPTTSANFNRTHNANLRLTTQLVAQFTSEVDAGNLQVIDLSDKNKLTNSKKLVYATEKQFNEKVADLLSQTANKVTNLDEVKLKLLNTDSEVWVNTTKEVSKTGNETSLTKGYAVAGSTANFNESLAASITELINNGTVTLESFGDTSIYSHFGHVKLGTDGFVRMNRQKYFVVENKDNSYIRTTPSGIDIVYKGNDIATVNTITDSAGNTYKDLNNTEKTGYIHLDAGIISLWDGYILEKPVGDNQVLTYSQNSADSKALCWKTSTNVTGSIENDTPVVKTVSYITTNNGILVTNDNSKLNLEAFQKSQYELLKEQTGVYYKIGSFKYKGFNIQTGAVAQDISSGVFVAPGVVWVNGEVQVSLSTKAYNGEVRVGIQVYKNGNARLIIHDDTTKFTELKAYGILDPTTAVKGYAYPNCPLSFKHTPTTIDENGQVTDGEIEFYVYVPASDDCHWSIHTAKEEDSKKQGYSQWVHVQSTENSVNYIPQAYVPAGDTLKDPEAHPYTPYLELIYNRSITFNGDDITAKYLNKTVILPNDENTYRLQFNKSDGFTWAINDVKDGKGVDVEEIEILSENAPLRTYLLGANVSHVGNNIKETEYGTFPTICTTSTIHRNIYYDPAGDLHASNFYNVSDIRLKENIKELDVKHQLPELKEFAFKHDKSKGYGFIAQEIEEAGYPELIHTDEDGYKRVNYINAYAIMFKQMLNEINELKEEIRRLKSK